MSNWKIKSEQNKISAKLLINNSYYSSSVHCSYYSNIQLMLHILLTDLQKSEQEIDSEGHQGAQDEGGFHNWLKNSITRELFMRNNQLVPDFNNFFGQLKGLRIKADYKNLEIIERRAKSGLDLSNSIEEILTEEFEI